MYQPFATVTLKTGETAELGLALAPEPGDPLGVQPLLAHKGQPWQWHIDEALARPLDGLETRFYLARVDGVSVSNVMTSEHAGVGILGHVYTVPEQRRKGLCKAIFECLMPDFHARGGLRMTLGTGYDRPPYWIYHGFGFRSVVPETGFMAYANGDAYAETWYAPGAVTVSEVGWRHWPTLAQLLADNFGQGLQFVYPGAFGPINFEGHFVGLYQKIVNGAPYHVRLLEKDNGAVVGLAYLRPDERWQGVWLLDLLAHPAFGEHLTEALDALPAVDGKVQAHVPAVATARRAALESRGFALEATLAGQLPNGGDVVVYARR